MLRIMKEDPLESESTGEDHDERKLEEMISFLKKVISHFVSSEFLDVPRVVRLSRKQVQQICQVIHPLRPKHRLQKSVAVRDMAVLLLPDYCAMKAGPLTSGQLSPSRYPVMSVEIKAKQGVALMQAAHLPVSAFCLKQSEKVRPSRLLCC